MRPSSRRSTARASSGSHAPRRHRERRSPMRIQANRGPRARPRATTAGARNRGRGRGRSLPVRRCHTPSGGSAGLPTHDRPGASTNAAPEVFPAPWMTPLTTPKRSCAWRTADVICLLSAESALTISTSDPSASICISLRIFRLTESSWAAESRCSTMSAGKFGAPGQHQPRLRLLRKCLGNLQPDVPETSGDQVDAVPAQPNRLGRRRAERRLIELLHEPPSGAMRHHWLRRSWP